MDNENNRSNSFASKAKDYYQLIKFTLSFTVVFSCVVCYLLAPNVKEFDWLMIAILFVAGMLVTGSANAINQAVEKDTDAIMKRTGSRPVAAGRMTQQEAYTFAVIAGLVGVGMMWYFFNLSSALLSAFSLFLYAFIYTPLKKINSIAVLVGALPGALPCLIGWVAGNDDFSMGGWIYFGIQFLWQFPHFWAIGWFLFEDYKKGGFFMLPTGKQDKGTAVQIIMYTIWTILVSVIPVFGFTGKLHLSMVSGCIVFLLGLGMLYYAIQLFKKMTALAAKQLMLASVSYITLVQIVYVIDKFIR